MRFIKPVLSYITLLIVLLSLFFGIGELYARSKYKEWYLVELMRYHSIFHHLPAPYFKGTMYSEGDFDVQYITNNIGMRGPGDYTYKKKERVFRIAVLGDSFTFGIGIKENETLSAQLEKLLQRSADRKYEVYNFGVNSFSPSLEYIYIKREIIKYKPDLVMLMLDISDVQDDYLYEPHLIYNKEGDAVGCDPMRIRGKPDLKAICMKHSRFFNLIDQKLLQSLKKMKVLGFVNYFSNKFRGVRNKAEIFRKNDIDNIYFDKFIMFREKKNREIVLRHWQRTSGFLMDIKRYLDKENIQFILATYPYGHQVGEHQWKIGRSYWAFEQDKVYDPSDGFAIIKNFTETNSIPFINVYDGLINNKDKMLYFDRDGHWAEEGHKVAAETIFNSEVFKDSLKKSS